MLTHALRQLPVWLIFGVRQKNMKAFAIIPERESEVYRHLLDWAEKHAASFHLVLRHGLEFDTGARDIIRELQADTLAVRITREWAGTTAMDAACVVECRISERSLSVLRKAPGIFAWCYPERPEDLALFTADGRCVFNSVSHHDEAWICDPDLKEEIEMRLPQSLIETEFEAAAVTFDESRKEKLA